MKANPAKRTSMPKIPKGFVMVNLTTRQQKEMRILAKESGMTLRNALRMALIETIKHLRVAAMVQRKTGMNGMECYHFFIHNPQVN